MNRGALIAAALALVLGLGGGYAIAEITDDGQEPKTETHSDVHSHSEGETHAHDSMFMVDAAEAPAVNFTVEEDAKSGWNVTINTTDFKFTPENVNGENIVGEGHAHLYVDGEKVGRLYSPYYHYSGSFDGTKTFRVTLNANDHSEYVVGGNLIEAQVEVTHEAHN